MPGANESSTVEWQKAHWMPIDLTLPSGLAKAVTPTTAFSLSSAMVVAGSSRSTLPAASCFFNASGSASASTLRPTESAVLGETPGPTPPFFSPAMALCSCKRVAPERLAAEGVVAEGLLALLEHRLRVARDLGVVGALARRRAFRRGRHRNTEHTSDGRGRHDQGSSIHIIPLLIVFLECGEAFW